VKRLIIYLIKRYYDKFCVFIKHWQLDCELKELYALAYGGYILGVRIPPPSENVKKEYEKLIEYTIGLDTQENK